MIRDDNKIIIKFRYSDIAVGLKEDDTVIQERYQTYYLNFKDAQDEQKRLRNEEIQTAFKLKVEADKRYNKLIEKYFDKPLTQKNEIK